MTNFRPISLCNVCYKIISKVLCQRLQRYSPDIISETQSAFVAGRAIADNILLAQEAFHALRTNNKFKNEFMAIKTDMSKAYDRVEWDFLEAMMRKMGFREKWIQWIMRCVRSVSYSVLINGNPTGHINPSRGLHQGDPLSPYLFILCTEVLIANIRAAENSGHITGLKVAQANPPISHLLFADDSLFFCKAATEQCNSLLNAINEYGNASGQRINFEKLAITFGKKVPPETMENLKNIFKHQQ